MKIELAHDFIAKKIYEEASIEDKMRAKATKYLMERYQHYCTSKNLLLTKGDLAYISRYVKKMDLNKAQLQYIKDSKATIRKQKLMARLKDAVMVASVCAVFFSSWGVWERQRYNNTSTELAHAKDSIIHLRNMKNPGLNQGLPIGNDHTTGNRYGGPASSFDTNKKQNRFSTIKISGNVKNEMGTTIPAAMVDIMGAETTSKADGSFELYLVLPHKDLGKEIQLKVSKVNYFSTSKFVDTDQHELSFEVVLKRG